MTPSSRQAVLTGVGVVRGPWRAGDRVTTLLLQLGEEGYKVPKN